MTFLVLPPAQDDLQYIDNWVIAKFGLAAADKAANELYETFKLLAEFQDMGHRRPEVTARPILFFSSHLNWIIYEPGDPLLIHRVFPARTDIRNLNLYP